MNNDEALYKMPSMEEIDSGQGMPTLYRVAFKNQLESLFKYGYNRVFTGTKGGNMYGPGVYCTFNLNDSIENVKTKPEYGNCIVQMRLIGGFDGFIIFDERLAQKTYGENWTIARQMENVAGFDRRNAEYVEKMCANASSLYHGRTAPAALYIWRNIRSDLFLKHGVKGLIYKGNRDGHCALPYDFSSVIPYGVSFNQGRSFEKRFNEGMYNFLKDHPDVVFRYGGKYNKVFQSVAGFTLVKDKGGKYNIIQNDTNKLISKKWFDEVRGQINADSGVFSFKCDGIWFNGSIYTPEGGTEIGCILDSDLDPYCDFSDLDELLNVIKQSGAKSFKEFEMMDSEEETDESVRREKIVIKESQLRKCILENVNKALNSLLFEGHLKVVNNINDIVKLVGETWTSPDDVWWIKIESRLKDHMNYNRRNNPQQKKWWSRVPGPDGTSRENHVGYVIVRGADKEACQRSILNAVVHLNPWAAKQCGVKNVYSNGNAEAIKLVCNYFFARSYITINKRSMNDTIGVSRRDKKTGLFRGREFHHRAGQTRTGVDSSGVNWTVKRPLGLIDCDIDNDKAQAELDKYLSDNGVTPLFRKPSHDGMHYVISIKDAEGLDFSFLGKYATNNRPGDPNVLFKPDANLLVYSAVG